MFQSFLPHGVKNFTGRRRNLYRFQECECVLKLEKDYESNNNKREFKSIFDEDGIVSYKLLCEQIIRYSNVKDKLPDDFVIAFKKSLLYSCESEEELHLIEKYGEKHVKVARVIYIVGLLAESTANKLLDDIGCIECDKRKSHYHGIETFKSAIFQEKLVKIKHK
jgi:hypothetical protein